jgi:transglutaminase-like putative cysteine protease
MPFRRIHKVIAYLMAAQGLGLLALSGELTAPGSIVALAALVASWFVEGERFAGRRWVNVWNGLTVAVFVVQIVRWMAGEGLPVVAVQFAAFLQVNKLFNRRRQNDYDQIAILSLLHLIASAILTTEISYALVFVLYAVVTPWMLVLGQIRREVEAKYWDRSDHRSLKDLERVLNSRRIISGTFLMSTALLSIPIYMMTALLFLFFPRIGFGLLASDDPSQRQLTGFSDQVVIGDLEPLFDDPTVVLRVEFPGGPPDEETLASLYWRGSSYDRFDGSQWFRTLGHGRRVPTRGDYHVLSRKHVDGRPDVAHMMHLSVFLQPLYPKVVFLPQESALVRVPAPEPLRVMRQKLRWGPGGEVRYTDPGGTGIHYDVWVPADVMSRQPVGPFDGRAIEEAESVEPYLQLPLVSSGFEELADRFAVRFPEPLGRASAVERWLRTSFGYTVTSSRRVAEDETPVEAFLFEWKEGNCEYFSTAMVLLMRATGVPSRNVTGFIGGSWNDVGDYLAVRESDAHSWVEVHDPVRGWVLFDPTPPAEPSPADRSPLALARDLLDTVRLSWHKHVIAYDLQHQAELLRRGYRGFSAARAALRDLRVGAPAATGGSTTRLVVIAAIVAAFILLFAARGRVSSRSHPLSREQRRHHRRVLDLIGLLDRRLEEVGLRRPAARPPLTHARIVSSSLEDSETLRDIVVVYNQTRFGGVVLARDRFDQLRSRIVRIRRRQARAPSAG